MITNKSISSISRVLVLWVIILSCPSFASAELTVEDFTREASFRDAKVSPNGKYLATVWNKDQYRYLSIQDISKPGAPVISSLGDQIRRPKSVIWVNDERLLVTVQIPANTKAVEKDLKRKKDFDIYDYYLIERTLSIDIEIKNPVVMMSNDRRVRYNRRLSDINLIKEDKQHVLMPAYRGGVYQLFKVNIYTGESTSIARGNSKTFSFLYDEFGNPKFRFDYYRRANKVVIRKYLSDTKWEKIDSIDFDDDVIDEENSLTIRDLVGWYNGKLAYRKRNEDTGFYEIILRDLKSGEVSTLISLKDKDIQGLVYDEVRNIVGYWPLDDLIRFKYFDERSQQKYDKLANQLDNLNFHYHGRNSTKSIIKTYGRDLAGSFFIYDHKENKLTFLQEMYTHLSPEKLATPAKIKFKTRDDVLIHSNILLPPKYNKEQKYPMVVLPHGGPHARETASYDDFAQFIATRGYIVVQPNFRGSTGYGRDFEESGYKQWGMKMQDDLVDTARFFIDKGYADKDKVCIVGISYGGYAALMGAVNPEGVFKCSISINGVTHLKKIVQYDIRYTENEEIEQLIYQRMGHPKTDQQYLDNNSPALHAEKIDIPVLLIAGKDDSVVPYSQAQLMKKALQKHDKTYEFITLKDTGHNPFYYVEDQEKVYTAVEKFLENHLNSPP